MNFYLLDLVGKWASLIFVSLFSMESNTDTMSSTVTNNNMIKDSNVVANEIIYTTVTKYDSNMFEGTSKVETTGVNGLIYTSNNMNIVIQEMVPQVLVKGTKKVETVKKETSNVTNLATIVQDKKIVYDNMTMEELSAKLNKYLGSTLSNTGELYAKYSINYGVDPYVAVAITLLETGCSGTGGCSTLVKQCYNVGGMKGSPGCNGSSYKKFNTLEEGIERFIYNLKVNYYDDGLNTVELMAPRYAASKTWSTKVNNYVNKIKAS